MALNRLLSSLPPDLLKRIEPDLTTLTLKPAHILLEPGGEVETIYFPTTGMVSIIVSLQSGHTIEATIIGSDGFVGLPALFGSRLASYGAQVQIAGDAEAMSAKDFRRHLEDQRFRDALGAYALAVFGRMAQSTGCVAFHPVEQRLSRWLLMVQDAIERDEFPLTQDFIGVMLGVARPSVSIAVRMLVNAGLIGHRRGMVSIVDRDGLELAACECYAATATRRAE